MNFLKFVNSAFFLRIWEFGEFCEVGEFDGFSEFREIIDFLTLKKM